LFACVLLDGLLELCLVVCFKLQVKPICNIKKGDFMPAKGSFRSARTIRTLQDRSISSQAPSSKNAHFHCGSVHKQTATYFSRRFGFTNLLKQL
jgi:hypothetical protein